MANKSHFTNPGGVTMGQTSPTIKGTYPPPVAGAPRGTKAPTRGKILKKTGGGSSYG